MTRTTDICDIKSWLFILGLPAALVACEASGPVDCCSKIAEVDVLPARAMVLSLNDSLTFKAIPRDSRGIAQTANTVGWSSSDLSVATITPDGKAIAVGQGKTIIAASADGISGSAWLEVFVPAEIESYLPGQSYVGREGYAEYIPGELPVVISAPHGGDLKPNEINDRTYGVTGADRNTRDLTFRVRDALIDATGYAPHVIISHLHRSKLDPNREIVEAAQGDLYAEQAWTEFQDFIRIARETVAADYGSGMYFDIHGHGHPINRIELGYLLGRSDLNLSDAFLDNTTIRDKSSVRSLGTESELSFSRLLRGETSFGGYLQEAGFRSVPSPSDPSPNEDAYFTGGYNTRRWGSLTGGEVVSGIQLEHQFTGIRDTQANRQAYAVVLAEVIELYMEEHFGFFEPN